MDLLTAEVSNEVTHSNLKLAVNEKGVSMCVAITDLRKEGRAEGKAEGENMIRTLMQKLFAAGRIKDARNASNDKEYCAKLLAEFGLTKENV